MDSSSPQLSSTQQKVLNILVMPSAFLSILGSSAIIYLSFQRRKVQHWTSYTRLLVAMSTCDIILSVNIVIGTFLRPSNSSDREWAFGNDTTCNIVAFLNQIGFTGIWYQGMLSIYFLLTARFGMKNDKIAKRVEPFMHLLAIGYNVGAATACLLMGVYGERVGAINCFVSRYYGDGDAFEASDAFEAENKKRDMLVTIFYPIPVAVVTACLIFTQLVIYFFVRRHTKRNIFSSEASQETTAPDNHQGGGGNTSLGWSERTMPQSDSNDPEGVLSTKSNDAAGSTSSSTRRRKAAQKKALTKQHQRLRLVCSQAFLFVFSFFLCNIPNVFLAMMQSRAETPEGEMEILVRFFPVAVIQAILIPIQGLFNCLIFIRPKYLMLRAEFPNEEKRWTIKRIFLGQRLEPTSGANKTDERICIAVQPQQYGPDHGGDNPAGDAKTNSKTNSLNPKPHKRNMMSSMTASDGDFDEVIDALVEDERWQDSGSNQGQASGELNRVTVLEAIGEISESEVDPIPIQAANSKRQARRPSDRPLVLPERAKSTPELEAEVEVEHA